MKQRIADQFRKALRVLAKACLVLFAVASEVPGDEPTEPRRAHQAPAGAPVGQAPETSAPRLPPESKIRFDLDQLNAEGLQGPPDGLRTLHYEYCIPDRPEAIQQVVAIDPTLEIHRGARGRIGCRPDELLCLGHTHQPNYREILQRLAELGMVGEIRECFFE